MKGTLHGFEIPYTFNIPAAVAGDKVTAADKAMGDLASAYWVAFGKTGNPNGGGRPEWPRHDPAVDKVINFTNTGELRAVRSRGFLSNKTALAMIFKLAQSDRKSWHSLSSHDRLPNLILGGKFKSGIEVVRSQAQSAAA